jgi:hypothetical protein
MFCGVGILPTLFLSKRYAWARCQNRPAFIHLMFGSIPVQL